MDESQPLVERPYKSKSSLRYMYPSRKNRTLWIVIGLVLLVVLVVVLGVAIGVSVNNSQGVELYDSIQVGNLMTHLQEWQDIAEIEENMNSRAVMYGFNQCGNMVYEKLLAAGYTNVTRQSFKVATYVDYEDHTMSASSEVSNEPAKIDFVLGSDFNVLRYSGATDGVITAPLEVIDCDLSGFTSGNIALVSYSDCAPDPDKLFEMAERAKTEGAAGLIFARDENDSNKNIPPRPRVYKQTAEDFEVVDLPMLGLSYPAFTVLQILRTNEPVTVTFSVNMTVEFYDTFNVLCYTDGGNADSIIVMGSHLDSVPAGPGINDNGSGSSANLEIALQLINSGTIPENKILFAFWGAEEWGLLGSYHFVESLTVPEREEIALNLNFDMIGSPNYMRGVYNGSGATNEKVVEASTIIQNLFTERFESVGLVSQLTPFTGRSDYGPFIAEGVDIPAGGLFTGAEALKTVEEQEKYGGLANAPYDPCYHKFCDTTTNINEEVFEQMSQAAAYVLSELMMKPDLRAFLKPSDYDYYDDSNVNINELF